MNENNPFAPPHGWKPPASAPAAVLTPPEVGTTWQHTSGAIYRVVQLANLDSSRQEEYPTTVVYRHIDNRKVWARPLSRWYGSMTRVYIPAIDIDKAVRHAVMFDGMPAEPPAPLKLQRKDPYLGTLNPIFDTIQEATENLLEDHHTEGRIETVVAEVTNVRAFLGNLLALMYENGTLSEQDVLKLLMNHKKANT